MKKKIIFSAIALLMLLTVVTASQLAADLHFGLSKSAPEADASVTALEEVRLWFTQVPQDNSVRVRLVDSSGNLVETTEAARDADDGKVFSISLDHTPPAGAYTVAWRGIGDDGHVVTGEFGFSVAAN